MQALIITCLLCLQTSNPCDPNPIQSFTEGIDCSKCETDLRDYLNLPGDTILDSNLTEPARRLAELTEDDISLDLKASLDSLLSDAETVVEIMGQNPEEFRDLINMMKVEINRGRIAGVQSYKAESGQPTKAETLKKVHKQENLLEKINDRFKDLLHQGEALKKKINIMRGVLSLEIPVKEGRDTVKYGERLMLGEELVSKNGRWRFLMDKETGENVLMDGNRNEVMRSKNCELTEPLGPNFHFVMNNNVNYYLDIEDGKSTKLYCLSGISVACIQEKDVQCSLKLDNDGHLKVFLPSGEPCWTYL